LERHLVEDPTLVKFFASGNPAFPLKVVMVVSGLFFLAGVYQLVMSLWVWQHSNDIVPMFLSLYVTLGVFLLIAARNPSEHRSLILFAAWSSFAHAGVMLIQSYSDAAGRPELYGMAAILVLIGVPLIALAPGKRSVRLAAAPQL
jgi:hypothetical protein